MSEKKIPGTSSLELDVSPTTMTTTTDIIPKNRGGRKKGVKLDVINLTSGGVGGRLRSTKRKGEDSWNFSMPIESDGSEDDSSYSESSESDFDALEEEDYDEEEDIGVMEEMVGNRIIPIQSLCQMIRKKFCCRNCAVKNHRDYMNNFLVFAKEYEDGATEEEGKRLFRNRLERLEWRIEHQKSTSELYAMYCGGMQSSIESQITCDFVLSEKTYGIATTIYGVCERARKPHKFELLPEKVNKEICTTVHGNSKVKLFALNYKLAAAIQSMGCGSSDATKLVGFLDFPCGDKIERHLRLVEEVLGPIQEKLRTASEIDAVQDEVRATQENNDLHYHECSIVGHEHPRLPKLKCSYGTINKLSFTNMLFLYFLFTMYHCLRYRSKH